MPVGYLVSVALVALGTLFALVPLRSLGNLSFRLGLLLNEVPIAGFYWLLIWTSLAFVQGDLKLPRSRWDRPSAGRDAREFAGSRYARLPPLLRS